MLHHLTLEQMAQALDRREISPLELLDAHLRQIETENPRINAFVCVTEDIARRAAQAAGRRQARGERLGPLDGIPVTVKDSFDIGGLPTLCGSRSRLGHQAASDATMVAKLRAAGAVILGKTNCPELLGNYETDNFICGRTNNPWSLERTAGGSSGGESAAIAAFCSAGGLGSDGGGSIREPAHFCGIAGLKPTPGRLSMAGHFPVCGYLGGMMGVGGPMARTARDVRILFEALNGYDRAYPLSAPVPVRPVNVDGLRIGLARDWSLAPLQEGVKSAFELAARAAAAVGLRVEEFTWDDHARAHAAWKFFFVDLAAPLVLKILDPQTAHWTGLELFESRRQKPDPTGTQVIEQMAVRDALRNRLLDRMEETPVLLTPPCSVTAFPHRQRPFRLGGRDYGLLEVMSPLTPANVLGLPAVVVPVSRDEDGLPCGVQLVGRPWEEEVLLEVAVRLQDGLANL
jgi:Asp-tRNA(Asn)/Glu-tRNA(Gln) amidotransferase A subunit family amidase